jgi:hypothetical protein
MFTLVEHLQMFTLTPNRDECIYKSSGRKPGDKGDVTLFTVSRAGKDKGDVTLFITLTPNIPLAQR